MKKPFFLLASYFLISFCQAQESTQEFTMRIYLDKTVDGGSVIFFESIDDPHRYYYAPKNPKIAVNPDGTPKVSFVHYVENTDSGDQGMGGGVFHCVVGFTVSKEELSEAFRTLKAIDSRAQLAGPVVFKEGALELYVPDIDDPESEKVTFLGSGTAPIVDGINMSVTLTLGPKSATLLWRTLDTPNPMVNINFNMKLAGYNAPIEAVVTIDRTTIADHKRIKAAADAPMTALEVDQLMNEMVTNGAIKIEKIGPSFSASMDHIYKQAINQATTDFFKPLTSVDINKLFTEDSKEKADFLKLAEDKRKQARAELKQNEGNSISEVSEEEPDTTSVPLDNEDHEENDEASEASSDSESSGSTEETNSTENDELGTENGETQSVDVENDGQNLGEKIASRIAFTGLYLRRNFTARGKKTLNFKEAFPVTLPWTIGGNLGLSREDCPKCFIQINMDEPLYRQRPVTVLLGELTSTDFESYINSVSVEIRKKHQNGDVTRLQPVILTKRTLANNADVDQFSRVYGWKGDTMIDDWLKYEYRIVWNIFGGHEMMSGWEPTTKDAIVLTPPLERKEITLQADRDLLEKENVRMAYVRVHYSLGDKLEDVMDSYLFNISKDKTLSKLITILLPRGTNEFKYEINWLKNGEGNERSHKVPSIDNHIFFDYLPKSE